MQRPHSRRRRPQQLPRRRHPHRRRQGCLCTSLQLRWPPTWRTMWAPSRRHLAAATNHSLPWAQISYQQIRMALRSHLIRQLLAFRHLHEGKQRLWILSVQLLPHRVLSRRQSPCR